VADSHAQRREFQLGLCGHDAVKNAPFGMPVNFDDQDNRCDTRPCQTSQRREQKCLQIPEMDRVSALVPVPTL